MADPKRVDEDASLPEKRRPDNPYAIDETIEVEEKKRVGRSDSSKKQKLEIPSENNDYNGKHIDGTTAQSEEFQNIIASTELEDDEDDEEDYDAEEGDSDEDGEGHSNEEAETIDTKGKEIVMNDKGKGKMLVDSQDDDSSDDSGSNFSDGLDDSDVEDDLLAEIDLDNILPSRTRNPGAQAGLRISSNCGNAFNCFCWEP